MLWYTFEAGQTLALGRVPLSSLQGGAIGHVVVQFLDPWSRTLGSVETDQAFGGALVQQLLAAFSLINDKLKF